MECVDQTYTNIHDYWNSLIGYLRLQRNHIGGSLWRLHLSWYHSLHTHSASSIREGHGKTMGCKIVCWRANWRVPSTRTTNHHTGPSRWPVAGEIWWWAELGLDGLSSVGQAQPPPEPAVWPYRLSACWWRLQVGSNIRGFRIYIKLC